MNKALKVFFTILMIIGALTIALFLYIVSPKFPWKRNKAAKVAEEYVSQTYGVDLKAERVESDIVMIDGGGYYIYFTDRAGVSFEVHMYYDQKLSSCWCNYEKELFASQFKNQHEMNIADLWNEKIILNLSSVWLRDDEIPVTNGYLNYDRYEKDCSYYITIELDDKTDKVSDAQDIFDTITYIRENDLNANEIIVEYMSSEYYHADDVWFEINKEEYKTVDDVRDKLMGH